MKRSLKICSAFFAVCLLFTSCGGTQASNFSSTQSGENNPVAQNPVTPSFYGNVEGTVHDWKVSDTDKYLIKDGITDYKILVSAEKKDNEFISAAASDLSTLFEEATGITLEIADDSGILTDGRFLAIGDTKLASNASLGADRATLGAGGFVIKTVGDSVCMTGATEEAAMYAVYAFLGYEVDFEQYYTDFYSLKTGVTELTLKNYDVTDIPDFEYRIQSTGWIRWEDSNIKRMRWSKETELFIPADGASATWHNTFTYLPKATYQSEHPEWYSDAGNQICYTAHGDAGSREIMLNEVAGKMFDLFRQFPDRDWITFSIQDNQSFCTCDACAAKKAKYGADSAVVVQFCNELADKIQSWMESEEGKPYARDFRLMFFAYHATNAAPAAYNAVTDSYAAVDETVTCGDHVAVYYAETNGDYTQNLSDKGTSNTFVGDSMKAWASVSKEIYFWSYSTNFNYFLTPYNSFDAVQDTYKFAYEQGCKYIMTQDQWVQANAQTGWGIYKNWLHSKLGWDVNADVEKLTDRFFDDYFGPASETMRKLFDNWRIWAEYQTEALGYSGSRSVYINVLQEKFWPQRMLEGWIDMIDEAYADIESLKTTNAALYNEIHEHICIESIAYRYLLLELYNSRYASETLATMKKDFLNDVNRIGMTLMKNGQTLESVFNSWTF